MKDITGWIVEEYITATFHRVENNNLVSASISDATEGQYTGRFRFEHTTLLGGEISKTKWYTEKTAPKWLLSLYQKAIDVSTSEVVK